VTQALTIADIARPPAVTDLARAGQFLPVMGPTGKEVNAMTSNNSHQPSELDRYLARCGFTPHASGSTWSDRDTRQQITRVVREPGEQTELISLTPHSACLYKAAFSPRTPDAVITSALQAALNLLPPQAGPSPGRAGTAGGARTKGNGDMR